MLKRLDATGLAGGEHVSLYSRGNPWLAEGSNNPRSELYVQLPQFGRDEDGSKHFEQS